MEVSSDISIRKINIDVTYLDDIVSNWFIDIK
jgi:hypothetical protein